MNMFGDQHGSDSRARGMAVEEEEVARWKIASAPCGKAARSFDFVAATFARPLGHSHALPTSGLRTAAILSYEAACRFPLATLFFLAGYFNTSWRGHATQRDAAEF